MKDYLRKIYYLFIRKKSYSQDGEDLLIVEYFKDTKNGTYLDIGCHHPIRFSNTHLLYRKNWKGINIDANNFTINLFNLFRTRDLNLNATISPVSGLVNFYEFNDSALNGIIDDDQVDIIMNQGYKVVSKKVIYAYSINDLFTKYKIGEKNFEFLKIDVEGSDFEILKQINLKKHNVELIMIEKGSDKNNIADYLEKNFYVLMYESSRNLIFKKS